MFRKMAGAILAMASGACLANTYWVDSDLRVLLIGIALGIGILAIAVLDTKVDI